MKRINNLLVPVDFKEDNTQVLRIAAQISKYSDARITMLHVYSRPLIRTTKFIMDKGWLEKVEKFQLLKLERKIRNSLRTLYQTVPELRNCHVQFETRKGIIVKNIVKASKEFRADLVLMGTRGSSMNHRKNTRSAKVSLRIHTPVLVVPVAEAFELPSKIAFAYDLHAIPDFKQLDIIKVLGETFKAEIHLINLSTSTHGLTKNERDNLASLKAYFADFKPAVYFVSKAHVGPGISKYIWQNDISIIAVLHRSRNAVKRLFHKSLTKRLALHSSIPVLALDGSKV